MQLVRFSFVLLVLFFLSSVQAAVFIDGSSTVYPITEALVESYQESSPASAAEHLVLSVSGTGGGFQRLCRGEVDVVDASRPILEKERQACQKIGLKYIELPIAYDAIAVVVNPHNGFVHSLSLEELHTIWGEDADGHIVSWHQLSSHYPERPLHLYGPGPGSGTFDYFTTVVNQKSGSIRSDFSASQNDDVIVQGVMRDPNALAYFGYAYYVKNEKALHLLPLRHTQGGTFVVPSLKTICNGQYPLARPLFLYVSERSLSKPSVIHFIHYYMRHAARFVRESGYFPLSQTLYTAIEKRFDQRLFGTQYGGHFAHSANLDVFLIQH